MFAVRTNLLDVVHTVLQTHRDCGRRKKRRKLARGCGIIGSFHAEKNQFGLADRAQFGRGFNADALLELQSVEEEPDRLTASTNAFRPIITTGAPASANKPPK